MFWGALARPPETVQAGPGESPTYPRWGSEVEHRGPTRKAVRPEVGSECVVRHSPGSMAGQGAREKASPPGPPPGEGVVWSPSPEDQDPEAPCRPSQGRRLPSASRAWQGRRQAATISCGQLHAAAVVKAAGVAELERRWRQQECALGDEQMEGLQPAVGWRQQLNAGAGCDEMPPSASVRLRTVGQILHRFAE